MSTWHDWDEARVAAHNARVAGETHETAGEGCDDESKLHQQIIAECKHRSWFIVHSRMDKPTTTALGVTDFVIAADNGKTYWVEAKAKGKKLTREQAGVICWLQNLGHPAAVVRSLEEFLKVIE